MRPVKSVGRVVVRVLRQQVIALVKLIGSSPYFLSLQSTAYVVLTYQRVAPRARKYNRKRVVVAPMLFGSIL
jgi:hypothetical protein